ncbi:MAG TPA: hypothetical protein VF392_17800 [Terracidiphilus sp.]
MDIARLRSAQAPAFIALLIVLTISVAVVQSPPSTGIKVPLLRLQPRNDQISCDGRWEFIQLLDDGRTKINADFVREEDLPSSIKKIMETRAERVVYVVPSSGIPYYRLVETMSRLKNAVPDLHIGLISGTLRDAYTKPDIRRGDLPCDFKWPRQEF